MAIDTDPREALSPAQAVRREASDPRQGALRLTSAPARFFGRTPGLDGVRALAVLMVLVFHATLFRFRAPPYLRGGHLGVDLFFVLSGFLITALLLREFADNRGIKLFSFYGRRVLRLYPPLLFLLAVSSVYVFVTDGDAHKQLVAVLASGFYVLNWAPLARWNFNTDLGHLWSLSIEEQFYLIWPPILIGLIALRARVRLTAILLGVVIVGVIGERLFLVHNHYSNLLLNTRTDTKVDALLFGVLAAILWTHGLTPRRGINVAATIGLIYMLWAVRNVELAPTSYELYRTLFAVSAVLVILATVNGTWFAVGFLALRPMRAIGRVSYGLYLWHLPVYFAVIRATPRWPRWQVMAIALGITLGGTLASWYLVEKTAMRFKSRLEPRRPPNPALAGVAPAGGSDRPR